MTPDEQARERRLTGELAALNSQVTAASQGPHRKRLAELEARLDYEAFETGLYAAHPQLRLKRGLAETLSLKQTAELLPDAKTALIEYAVMNERAFLFVLTRGTGLKVYPLDIKREELARRVEGFRRALAGRDLGFANEARGLYDLLLAPARAELKDKSHLILVPDDALWELPFQALQTAPARYLIEDTALSYAPSLSVLYEMRKQRSQQGAPPTRASANATLLAFGNPTFGGEAAERTKAVLRSGARPAPLPEAEAEVKSLAEIYGRGQSRVYTGSDAREERAKTEAANFRILHFATHGVLNNSSPMYSHLLLSQGAGEDGLLEAWEIMRMDLKAELVVLSACETARGRRDDRPLVGALCRGQPRHLGELVEGDSLATKQLMLHFHRHLRAGNGKSEAAKAEAIRQAALRMLRSSEHRRPFNWAGFVIIGDSR